MRIRHLAMLTALGATLSAEGGEPGFQWVGVRAGTMSFDPQEKMKAAPILGAQGGLVFDEQRYGLSLELLRAQPESSLFPGQKPAHNLFSVTLMTGLTADSMSPFWPYMGLGLGSATVAKTAPSLAGVDTSMSAAAHASFGFLHRPVRSFIWGAEGRYLITFANPGLNAFQGSVLVGFTWGGAKPSRRPAPSLPSIQAKEPPPPAPLPVVEMPAPPPRPAPVVAPAPVVPVPAVTVRPTPPPAPPPVVAPVPAPAPPPVRAPAPAAPAPAVQSRTPEGAITERLDALRLGHLDRAVDLGRKHIQKLPANRWTLRLEIASLPSTLKNAVAAFPGREPDLFIAPIKLRGGKTSYQLFLGDYASKAEAERAARTVPSFFLEDGQRPKPFLVSGIPTQGNQ